MIFIIYVFFLGGGSKKGHTTWVSFFWTPKRGSFKTTKQGGHKETRAKWLRAQGALEEQPDLCRPGAEVGRAQRFGRLAGVGGWRWFGRFGLVVIGLVALVSLI